MSTAVRELSSLPRLPGLPVAGNLVAAQRDPIGMFERLALLGGDAGGLSFGPYKYLVVHTPELVQQLLVANAKSYFKSPSYRGLKMILGNGLITSEGDFWKRQRKLAQPAFHRERLAKLAEAMVRDTADMLLEWRRAGEGPFDLHDQMMRLTLRIVGHTLFSTDVSEDAGRVGEAFSVAIERANVESLSLFPIPDWVPLRGNVQFRAAMKVLDGLVHRIIAERRAMPESEHPHDLLSMLMSARDDDGQGMSDTQLRDEVMSLVGAGHETTANALSWTFYVLGDHPEAAARVAEEARAVCGDREPTFADVPKLTYTKRVVEESMRLYPPVWAIERIAREDNVVGDIKVPKGTLVGVVPWCVHRDPRNWPDPERFDPDRFLPEAVEARHRYAYLPFGAGPRVCIGNSFAMMEAQLLLAMIAREFHMERAPWRRVQPEPSVTLRPKQGLTMVRRNRARPAIEQGVSSGAQISAHA